MLKWIGVLAAIACTVVPQASAKGQIVLCGRDGCTTLGTEGTTAVRWWGGGYDSHVAPVTPAPFFKLQFAENLNALAYWIPSAGVLRVLSPSGPAMWVQPRPDEVDALTQASALLRSFPAPRSLTVAVDAQLVPRGQVGYLRLFTSGTPVAGAVRARGWLPIDFRGAETPWTDAYAWMWISKAGAFLKHADGDVLKISPRLAKRIRNRLPLAPEITTSRVDARAPGAACLSARVHYEPAPHGDLRDLRLPWVSAGRKSRRVVGYLWYYTPDLRARDRLEIYVGGQLSGGRAFEKIMWVPNQPEAVQLRVDGDQLDGPGHFQQESLAAHSGRRVLFPSIVAVPAPGCWRLTVRNGGLSARFAVLALAP